MSNSKLVTVILATATVAALTAAATADRNGGRDADRNAAPNGDRNGDRDGDRRSRQTQTTLGEVDTHARDAEDYVPIAPPARYDTITLTARGGTVPIAGLKIQYADGRIVQPMARARVLRPGQEVAIDVPDDEPIQMLVLDYDERRSARMGDRATARVEVLGLRTQRVRYQGQRYDRVPLIQIRPRDAVHFNWRGRAFIRAN